MNTTVNASSFSNPDTATALYMIGLRNTQIMAENARRAALTPPGTPLPLLAVSTNPEIKASYEVLLVEAALSLHANWMADAAANNATAKQVQQALKASPTQAQLNAALIALTS